MMDSTTALAEVPELSVPTILESIPDAVVVAEYTSSEIVAVNDAAGELFDCRTEALVGLDHLALHPSGEADLYREAFDRGFESEQVERLQDGSPLYVETSTGERKPVEINAQRIQTDGRTLVLGVFRDISNRIDRERRLEQTTTRLNTLVDATPLPVAVLDTSGRIELWNQAAEEVFGYSSEQVTGDYYPLLVDEDLDDLLGEILDGGIPDGYETVLRAQDGSRIDAKIYARPLYEDGTITGIIGSAVDITDQKRRNQHLDVVHRLLRHNLRNNLTVIQGYASMLSEETETDAATEREAAERIAAASEELAELSTHAAQVRRVVRASGTHTASLAELLATITEAAEDHPQAVIEPPEDCADASVSSQALEALSWLFSRVLEYVDEPSIGLSISLQEKFVQLDIHGDAALLPPGDTELVTNGEETALRHGSDLDIARAYLTLTSIGGDIIQRDDSSPEHSLRVEIPRAGDGD